MHEILVTDQRAGGRRIGYAVAAPDVVTLTTYGTGWTAMPVQRFPSDPAQIVDTSAACPETVSGQELVVPLVVTLATPPERAAQTLPSGPAVTSFARAGRTNSTFDPDGVI